VPLTERGAGDARAYRCEHLRLSRLRQEGQMSDNVYSVSEIVGSSEDSIEDAIAGALARARKTLRNLNWFEVTEIRGHLDDDGNIGHYQVTLKLGFRME
jgi:flavin-binding protein dodecin